MKLRLKILAVAVVAAASYAVVGCAGPAGYSYQNVTITLTPFCEDCSAGIIYNPAFPVPTVVTPTKSPGAPGAPSPPGSVLYMANAGQGGTDWFQADVTNAPPNITWAIYPTPDLGDITVLSGTSPLGSTCGNSGNTLCNYGSIGQASGNVAYFAVSGIPTYTGGPALQQALAMNIPQGMVLLTASVPSDPANPSSVVTARQLIQVYNNTGSQSVTLIPKTPTTPSGLTTSVATVPRGTTFQFTGFAVGVAPCFTASACNNIFQGAPLNSTDNTVVWLVGDAKDGPGTATVGGLVNGVPGPYGTIDQNGLYTAPPVIPISGFQPLIVLEAHAAPTAQAVAYVTVN